LLTLESIRAYGLECRGIALNTLPGNLNQAMQTNRRTLEEICDVPILFDIKADQRTIQLAVA
jgi:dethiobiotin synthetase